MCCTLTTLFLPQAGTAPCDEVSPEPPFPPVRKTEPTGNNQTSLTPTIALWIALQEPLFIPQGLQRNPRGSTPRASNRDRETARLATTRTPVLADQVHTCRAQAVNATSDFAHLQSQVGGRSLMGNLSEVHISPIQSLRQGILLLEPCLPKPRQGATLQVPYGGERLRLPQNGQGSSWR